MSKKLGRQTFALACPPAVAGWGSIVGKKEGEGPLGPLFDRISTDSYFGEKTWEKAESVMQQFAVTRALERAGQAASCLDALFGGDLMNQCIATGYAARALGVPFFGLYGACSTMAEGLGLASLLVDGGFAAWTAAVASSHFCTAERQYRMPLEYGGQRTPTAQWTATASGAVVLAQNGPGPYVTHVTAGKICDPGIKDANNMGAAMAPAAYDTIRTHLADTGRSSSFYDLIVTGDLGKLGCSLVTELFRRDGVELSNYTDCGVLLYDLERQDVHCGGSGCGCSAAVLTGRLLGELQAGTLQHVLFCGTGALHSPVSLGQGESVPGICHAVALAAAR
ncbi:MAG TPA: stage V sporulation protein AD [Candidatus Onthomonas avicola]|nr:stage V sporulation protein AD [Candidatus Onthomonas avicola]